MNPKYPIYIPSKGRWMYNRTARTLDKMGVPYRIVIEAPEYDHYAKSIPAQNILVLPFINQGLIAARNWIMEHSITEGHRRHWQIDDNVRRFCRFHDNQQIPVADGTILRCAEDFTDRYTNVAFSGLQYETFVERRRDYYAPFRLNTRIYSITLVNNAIPYRWRSVYNDDTDISLCALKDGWCTILFLAFLADKTATMDLKGGNTDTLYKIEDGRLKMAQALQELHPDVTTITEKWGRPQHLVDYRKFKNNKLIKVPGLVLPKGNFEYGMRLVKKSEL
jgi:hypothetical protein